MGPDIRSCICFGSSSHSIPSPDAAFVTVLPKRCHKQQLSSFFQHCIRGWIPCRQGRRWETHDVWTKRVKLQTKEISALRYQVCKTGWQGNGNMAWVWGVCTHNRLGWSKTWRAPTSQMNLCQRQPGIPEGVFQWWCYPHTTSTGKRREWVSAELATLYSHTHASLWMSISLEIIF